MDPGQVIADRFEIERLVGSGGMGSVYRARDRLTGGPVAIKLLLVQLARDKERFKREAQLLAEVSHPRVVKYVAHGVTAANHPYLAMEWLEGEDLAERLTRTGLTMGESVLLTKRVAEALGTMHERGIVHRDIKPSNLFLPGGEIQHVKLLDLGIARFADPVGGSTRTGTMLGTPGYMAPEQARGTRALDARVDVFSLGCVLFECLTGTPAFVGENIAAVLAKILLENSPRVRDLRPEVPEALDDLVARMLSKHPAVRPADGMAIARELGGLTTIGSEGPRPTASREVRALTGGERRLVSVVMAAPREGALDPGASTFSGDTVAASNDRLYAVVAPYGAQLECLANGSLVATVMGRRSATDQAAHAARCALALRQHIPDAPMALATGLGVVSERFLAGDVIDRAAALLLRAEEQDVDGTAMGRRPEALDEGLPIRLDETTAGLLDLRFDVGGDEKGLALFGQRAETTLTRTVLGKATPFVGRDRELDSLLAVFDESAAEPVARVVLVTASAGFGKSRLAHELVRKVRERPVHAEIWSARGDPMSEGSPFSMLGQTIRHAAGVLDGEPHVVRQQKLRARLGRHLEGEQLSRVAEFLGELVGTRFADQSSVQLRAARHDAMLMGDQMRRAWEDWIAVECAAQPVLIILEDLQWGDLPSVRFMEAALRNLEESPLMILAMARPDVHDVFPGLWAERGMQEVRLAALTKRAAEKLVREVLGSKVDARTVASLVERSSGNAFYLEELIRAHAEGRGEKLPETVLAMVEARLERLDPEARRVLRGASVFGQVFWRTGVLALLGGERKTSEVDEWLHELEAREVIARRGEGKFADEREYAFRHGLVREAAYAMLTTDDRTLGHRLAGEWLQQVGETEAVVLAEHFERGKLPVRAVEWYRRAAMQALEGNDFAAAMDRSERAVACGAAGETLGALRLCEAEASNWAGEHREAETHALAAMKDLTPGSDDWFLAGAETAAASWRLGHRDQLVELARAFRAIEPSRSPTIGRCIATARLASRLYMAGFLDEGNEQLTWLEGASAELRAHEPAVAGWVLHAKALHATMQGDVQSEVELLEAAVNDFEAAGDARNACVNRHNLAVGLTQYGVYGAAERHLRQALETAERLGLYSIGLGAKQNLGIALSRQDRFEEAIALELETIASFHERGDAVMEGASRGYLAVVLLMMDRVDEALGEVKACIELVRRIPPLYAPALGAASMIELRCGRPEEALEAASEAVRIFKEGGGLAEGESLIRIAYAEALEAVGRHDAAVVAVREARDRLLERADRITNPEWRRCFLQKVRENARTLARAGEWLR
jgi:tetratricopeptide (TPR) repeat protein